jgi:hypothetical protein
MLWYAWTSLSRLQQATVAQDIPHNVNMAVDSERADPAVSGPALASFAAPDNEQKLSASAIRNDRSMSGMQLRKIQWRRANNRHKKDVKAYAPAPYQEGHDLKCQFCPCMFERAGLLKHL